MDEVAKKIASLGLPGIILLILMSKSGGMGTSYALLSSLARLGGPFGLMGGLAVLGLMTAVVDLLSGYGIEALLFAIYQERRNSESLNFLLKEINDLPISYNLKIKLKSMLESADCIDQNPEKRRLRIVQMV